MKTWNYCLVAVLTLTSVALWAAEEKQLFLMEKSHNPENIMIIHAQTGPNCSFETFPDDSYINYYWMMDRSTKKDVHSLIRSGIAKRLEFTKINPDKTEFEVRLNDLEEVDHDLETPAITVTSKKEGADCKVQSILTLGPSEKRKKMDLNRMFCEVDKNMVGVPKGCKFLELEGVEIENGAEITVRYDKS